MPSKKSLKVSFVTSGTQKKVEDILFLPLYNSKIVLFFWLIVAMHSYRLKLCSVKYIVYCSMVYAAEAVNGCSSFTLSAPVSTAHTEAPVSTIHTEAPVSTVHTEAATVKGRAWRDTHSLRLSSQQ